MSQLMLFKTFGWSALFTVVAIGAAFVYAGPSGAAIAGILIVLEVSLSFDNAVVNARVLQRMSALWQKLFLTVGVLIAVVGMRLIFPFVVVGITAGLSPARAWDLAMDKGPVDEPGTYGYILHEAHPSIAAFGAMFLIMIFLDFMFGEKESRWLKGLEQRMERFGELEGAAVIVALGLLLGFGYAFQEDNLGTVLASGVVGLLAYLVVNGLGELFDAAASSELDEANPAAETAQLVLATGKAALFLFLYLEVLDASFSFDGVIGAFAITSDPIIIGLGLGVGALYVRSLTVYLVRKGTLSDYIYLEHGAHWAIGALAILLLVTMGPEIPEVVTGLVGVTFILAAFLWSVRHNRQQGADKGGPALDEPVPAPAAL